MAQSRSDFGIDEGPTSPTFTRRNRNHHPNLWSDELIQSLTSPYGVSSYLERRETLVKEIGDMLKRVGDGEGEFRPSPYDTAWVARIPAIDDSSAPHFPQTLGWILENQEGDGSWGSDDSYSEFSLADQLLNTLACILALVSWERGQHNVNK
ncbi:hypothetical protein KI387_021264, partial [Taxus chinensis]